MISVALATYNSSKYIIEQLQSLITQTKEINELIICDDCSSDNTIELIENYFKQVNYTNYKIFINSHNLSYVKTFSKAISETNGDIIFLCDHDDVWHADKIEKIEIEFLKNNNISVLGSSFTRINSEGLKIDNKNPLFTANNGLYKYYVRKNKMVKVLFNKEFTYNFTPGCCIAFKKEIKQEIIKGLNIAPHDYYISCLAASFKGLYFINTEMIDYRLHNNNAIGIPNKDNLEFRIKITEKDIKIKQDIFENLSLLNINEKHKKFMLKHIKVVEKRKEYLENKKIFKMFTLFLKTLFMYRYWYTILKDIKLLIRKENI